MSTISENGLFDGRFRKDTSTTLKRKSEISRNPDLPTENIYIPGNLVSNVSNDLKVIVAGDLISDASKLSLKEIVESYCILTYEKYIQDTVADYTTAAEVDNKFTILGNSVFTTQGIHKEIVEGNQYQRISKDQRTKIGGSEYLNISKDFRETIEGNEVSDARKNFIISVGGPNLVYTRKDEILNIGGQEKMTIVGSLKYYIGGSDFVNVTGDSMTNVKNDWDDDISGDQIIQVKGEDLIEINQDSKNIVGGTFSVNVGKDQIVTIEGMKEYVIKGKYDLTTPKFNVNADVKLNGKLSGNINGEINVINTDGGEVLSGRWFPIPWSSVHSVNSPGIRFDQSTNKFIIEEDGNYSFSSFVNFNLVNSVAITRVRISCCCGEKVILGSNITKYLTSSFIRGVCHIKKNTCVYFEYMASTSSVSGFGAPKSGKINSSLTITKL